MDNMSIYSQLAVTPPEAKKPIQAGRLRGFTDINPMWRIKRLTEVFGPFGIGWYYVTTKREFVPGANGEVACMVDIDLFYINPESGECSKAVPGSGGSMFVSKEKNGLYTSDEAVKMATTDAIGSACKLLGMSSDIYFERDRTKYSNPAPEIQAPPKRRKCSVCGCDITGVQFRNGIKYTAEEILQKSNEHFHQDMCFTCLRSAGENDKEGTAK